MTFTNEDYLDILRHAQTAVRRFEPELFESLSEIRQTDIPPRLLVLRYLSSLIDAIRQGSGESYPRILSLLSKYIKPIEGREITGIKIVLSLQERELFQMSEVDLSELPERDELIAEIHRIYNLIESESPEETSDLR